MRVKLLLGYKSTQRTNGKYYPAGVHDLEIDLANHLIEIGDAVALEATPTDVEPIAEADIDVTEPAQKLMDLFDLTVADFPGVVRITKPMVDAFIAELQADGGIE